jgi:GxxExxY protein
MKTQHENLGSDLTGQVIGAAIAVHREFGPGLDEADYERALHLELLAMGIEHECQVPLPLIYKGTKLDCGYRMDLVVAGWLLLELKAVEKLHPLHEAQLITYLRLARLKLGLLMNFGSLVLRDGIVRRANSSASEPKLYAPGIPPVRRWMIVPRSHGCRASRCSMFSGTGLLRSAYEAALAHELKLRGLKVEQRLPVNLLYREQLIPSAKELPMVVEGRSWPPVSVPRRSSPCTLPVSGHCSKPLESKKGSVLISTLSPWLRRSNASPCLPSRKHRRV